ncbi:MAG TPA: hypothetical protein VI278_15655 [Nitrososphaeraceae archaeon]
MSTNNIPSLEETVVAIKNLMKSAGSLLVIKKKKTTASTTIMAIIRIVNLTFSIPL